MKKQIGIIFLIISVIILCVGWGKIMVEAMLELSPAQEVQFIPGEDEVDPYLIHCHDAAVVDGEYIWQFCNYELIYDSEASPYKLVRYHLKEGTAKIIKEMDDLISPVAVIKHPQHGLFFVLNDLNGSNYKVYQVLDNETMELIHTLEKRFKGIVCFDDRLEMVEANYEVITVHKYDFENGNTVEYYPIHDFDEGYHGYLEMAYYNKDHWNFIYSVKPTVKNFETIPYVDLYQDTLKTDPVRLVSVPLSEDMWQLLDDNNLSIIGEGFALDKSAGGFILDRLGLNYSQSKNIPIFTIKDGQLQEIPYPEENMDPLYQITGNYYFSDNKLRSIINLEGAFQYVWLANQWYKLSNNRNAYLEELGGTTGEPIANRFWLSIGFKMLPAADEGYWLMGSLGVSYVKINENLNRSDHLSFIERFQRLFVEDRAKHNSDLYNMGGLKKASIPIVLFLFPAGLLLLLFINLILRAAKKEPISYLFITVPYTILSVLSFYFFWEVSAYF